MENVISNREIFVIPKSIQREKNIINTVAISSAEAERGFSTMNLIYSEKRNRLIVQNLANLMVIHLIGLPLDIWNPERFAKTWLRKNHSADDNRVKKPASINYNDNQISIWKYLK